MKEAMFYEKLAAGEVRCFLCAHECRIGPGKKGICGCRQNRDGVLYTLVYDKVIARHVDPIEKKPLFHLLPGSRSYSFAAPGCNFRCRHCQNHEISQMPAVDGRLYGDVVAPAELVREAVATGCRSLACTYTEPTVYFELAYETALLAREQGLKNVWVSNGFMSAAATEAIAPCLDAINVDIKAFSDSFYRRVCGAHLQPVLDTVRRLHELGVWVEVTTLIIPGYNDSEAELRQIAEFIAALSPAIPWHVTGFYPTYKLTSPPPTAAAALEAARELGLAAGLRYVYEGNRPGLGGENTYCYACGSLLVERYGFSIRKNRLRHGSCPDCGVMIDGIFS